MFGKYIRTTHKTLCCTCSYNTAVINTCDQYSEISENDSMQNNLHNSYGYIMKYKYDQVKDTKECESTQTLDNGTVRRIEKRYQRKLYKVKWLNYYTQNTVIKQTLKTVHNKYTYILSFKLLKYCNVQFLSTRTWCLFHRFWKERNTQHHNSLKKEILNIITA